MDKLKRPIDIGNDTIDSEIPPFRLAWNDDDNDDEIICDVCGLPITGDDYDDRHQGHKDNCPNKYRDDDDAYEDCFCALEYHAECCPDCKEEVA